MCFHDGERVWGGFVNYFWFDHKASNRSPEHNTFKRLVALFNAKEVKLPSDLRSPFLCFAHAETAEDVRQWEEKANAGQGQFIALLSFGGHPTPTRLIADGVAALQKDRLNRGVTDLLDNANRKTEFMRSVSDGAPKWEMLAPNPETEHLIAYYLVLLATEKGLSGNADHELRKKAFQEYSGLAILAPSARKVRCAEDLSKDAIGQLLAEWEGK